MPDKLFNRDITLSTPNGTAGRLRDMGDGTFAEEHVARDPGLLRAVASTVLTRRANTTAYTAGQIVGGSAVAGFANNGMTFANFARIASGMVRLDRARLYKSQATAVGTFELCVFRGLPTISIADAGLFSAGVPVGVGSSDARLVARFAFDFATSRVGSDGAELAALPLSNSPAVVGLPANGTDLFALLISTGAYAPASGETFSVVLEGLAF